MRGAAGHALEALEERRLLAVDLLYSDLAPAGNTLPGGTVRVNSTIYNVGGTTAAEAFEVRFYLSQNSVFDPGVDTLLGMTTLEPVLSGTPPMPVVIPAGGNRGFPVDLEIPEGTAEGPWFIIGVADTGNAYNEDNEGNNVAAGQFFVGNTAPAIAAFTITPDPAERTSTLTLSATGVTDTDGINGLLVVDFYYDDGDGVFSEASDRLIAPGARSTSTFTYTGPVPSFMEAGTVMVHAVAFDGIDRTVATETFELTAATSPVVQALTKTQPGNLPFGAPITLRATGVSGPDDGATLTSVAIYRESNGQPGLQTTGPDADELAGNAMDMGNGTWSLDLVVVPAWGENATFYAQGVDSMDRTGNVAEASFTFVNVPAPTSGDLTGPTGNVRRGRDITLTLNNVTGSSPAVTFYRDTNGNGVLDIGTDEPLGNGTANGDDYSLAFTIKPEWGAGTQRFFARVVDQFDRASEPEEVTVGLIRNKVPRIVAGLTANKASASKGSQLRLTAWNVRDDDGHPERVVFYRETSGDNTLQEDQDEIIGEGIRTARRWVLTFTVPVGFKRGMNRFYARAYDIVGARSLVKTIQVRITMNTRPAIGTFNIGRNQAPDTARVMFRANNVTDNGTIASVRFYFDANNDGIFQANTDTLVAQANRIGQSNNWRRQIRLNQFGEGNKRFFAVAVDNLGRTSPARADTIIIT